MMKYSGVPELVPPKVAPTTLLFLILVHRGLVQTCTDVNQTSFETELRQQMETQHAPGQTEMRHSHEELHIPLN